MRKGIIVYSRLYDFDRERYDIGGIETYIRNLCPILADSGLEPHVIFPYKRVAKELRDGIHFHTVSGGAKTSGKKLVNFAETVGSIDDDLLVFGTSSLVCRSRFTRTIGIQHGIYWDVEEFHSKRITNRSVAFVLSAIQSWRQLRFHSLVSNMVCVDLNYVNWMRSLTGAARLPYTYIPNFAEVTETAERKHDSKVRIVFARRFEEVRGCRLLMQVLPQVLQEHPEVELTIAGNGTLSPEMHAYFDANPQVGFTTYDVTDSLAFHQQFDIAIVPSVGSEGTSLSLLEAMSAGCAVVATDVGGMSNIVLDGYNGMIVEPEQIKLYVAINRLIENQELRERISFEARRTVRAAFSREVWANKWADTIRKAMNM